MFSYSVHFCTLAEKVLKKCLKISVAAKGTMKKLNGCLIQKDSVLLLVFIVSMLVQDMQEQSVLLVS